MACNRTELEKCCSDTMVLLGFTWQYNFAVFPSATLLSPSLFLMVSRFSFDLTYFRCQVPSLLFETLLTLALPLCFCLQLCFFPFCMNEASAISSTTFTFSATAISFVDDLSWWFGRAWLWTWLWVAFEWSFWFILRLYLPNAIMQLMLEEENFLLNVFKPQLICILVINGLYLL